MPLSLILLSIGAFVIGTSEFVIVGLLQTIAKDFHITVSNAGLLVSFYAIGVVIGAPLVTLCTNRVRRNTLLFILLAFYSASNLLCALAPNYTILMLGRIIAAMAHGSFFGVGTVVAIHLVSHERAGRAVAVMFFGLTLANVIGVPIGSAIGQYYSWRVPFLIISALGGVAAIMLAWRLPVVPGAPMSGWRKEVAILKNPGVLIAVSITISTLAAIFTVFTYLSEFLKRQGHADVAITSYMLLLFGIGMTIGVINGGTLADRWPKKSAIILSAMLAMTLAAFTITQTNTIAIGFNLFLMGLSGASLVPGLQARVLREAKNAPNLASSLNIGAFNIGNAIGSILGSVVLANGLNLVWLAVIGASCGGISFIVIFIANRRSEIC